MKVITAFVNVSHFFMLRGPLILWIIKVCFATTTAVTIIWTSNGYSATASAANKICILTDFVTVQWYYCSIASLYKNWYGLYLYGLKKSKA